MPRVRGSGKKILYLVKHSGRTGELDSSESTNFEKGQARLALIRILKSAICAVLLVLIAFIAFQFYKFDDQQFKKVTYACGIDGAGDTDMRDCTPFYAIGMLNLERLVDRTNIDIYEPLLLSQSVQRTIAPESGLELYTIQYPPAMLFLFTAAATLPYSEAWRVWYACSVCFTIAMYCAVAWRNIRTPIGWSVGLGLTLLSFPSLFLLGSGQTSALESLAIASTFLLLRGERHSLAAIPAAISLLKLQFCPIVLIPGFFWGRTRFIVSFTIVVLLAAIASTLFVGWENVLSYIRTLYLNEVTRDYTGFNDLFMMSNLRGALAVLTGNNSLASAASVIVSVFSCVTIAFLWFSLGKDRRNESMRFELLASITIIVLLLTSIHCYVYDYILIAVPCVWLYQWCRRQGSGFTKVAIQITILLASPFLWWACAGNLPFWMHVYLNLLKAQIVAMAVGACAIAAYIRENQAKVKGSLEEVAR